MKNLNSNYKNKIYIVIVIITIILLLLVALVLLGKKEEQNKEKNTTTTISTTTNDIENSTSTSTTTTTNKIDNSTSTTTTTMQIITDEEFAYIIVEDHLQDFYIDNYIRNYDIKDIEILEEVDCHKLTQDSKKIYASVSLTYEKINSSIVVNKNEEVINGNNYGLNVIFVINKSDKSIETLKSLC